MRLSEVEEAIIRRAKADNPKRTKGKWRIRSIRFEGESVNVFLANIVNRLSLNMDLVLGKDERMNPRTFIAKKNLYSYFDEDSYVDLSPSKYAKSEGYSVSYAKECLEYTLRKGKRLTLVENDSGAYTWCHYGLADKVGDIVFYLESEQDIPLDWFEEESWLSEVEEAIIRRAKAENPSMTKGKWRIYRISLPLIGKRVEVLLAHIKNRHETRLKMVVARGEL